MHNQKGWLAAYLFYGEPWKTFLTDAVAPFAEQTLACGAAEQFFFIRYWEQGPHIRLRFKGAPAVLAEQVQPQLDAFFTRYFLRTPSNRPEPELMAAWPSDQQWQPNHTVCLVPYEPEVERYGGPVGMEIAEAQFCLSSRVVLRLLAADGWGYERALGAAIQLHLGLAWGLGMSLVETKHFYTKIFAGWLNRAYGYHPQLTAAEVEERRAATLEAFYQSFVQQQAGLINFHDVYWQALVDRRDFDHTWLNEWLQGMGEIGRQLRTAAARDQLVYPEGFQPDPAVPVSFERQWLWSILGSYVHMTNNRLGILNRDEAYLGYLIVKSLEQMELSKEGLG